MGVMESFGVLVMSKVNKSLRMMNSIIVTKRGNVVQLWRLGTGSVGVCQNIAWCGGWRQGGGHLRLQGVAVHLGWGSGCWWAGGVEDILCWWRRQWRQLGRIVWVPPAEVDASIIAAQRSMTAVGVRISHFLKLTGGSIVTLSVGSLGDVGALIRPCHCGGLVHWLLVMVPRYWRQTFNDIFRCNTI